MSTTKTFKPGDIVEISHTNGVFDGFKAKVVEHSDSPLGPYLEPLSDRPDGYGRTAFYWRVEKLRLVESATEFKVGDRVRATHNRNGDTAEFTVTAMHDAVGVLSHSNVYLHTSFTFEKIASPPPAEPKGLGAVVRVVGEPFVRTAYDQNEPWVSTLGDDCSWKYITEHLGTPEILSEGVNIDA